MANMNLNINMDNLTEEERNQLLALIEKSTKKKSKVWKHKIENHYYYIDCNGNEGTEFDYWGNNCIDEYRYTIGNCFPTKEKAEFAVERLKVIAELKRFAQEHNEKEIDWSTCDKDKFYLIYDYYNDCVNCANTFGNKSNNIYFTSREVLKQAIDTIGVDRIKKYYLEVED